jgi:hypothetical protein
MMALAAGLVVALAAPVLVYVGAKAITNSKAGKNVLADAPPEQVFPATPTAMLATVGAARELTSVTVFVLAPDADPSKGGYDQRGGSVISVPISADTGVVDQPQSLADTFRADGLQGLQQAVESALGVNIDFGKVMTRNEFAGLLLGLPQVRANLVNDVLDGRDAVIHPKGSTTLSTSQVAEIVTTKSPTQPETARRANIDALWQGLAAAVGSGREGQKLSTAEPTTFEELGARLMAGPIASRGLLARPVAADRVTKGHDLEQLDRADTILVFASVAPAHMQQPGVGRSYRLEAPPGYDQQVRRTIESLLFLGNNIVSVDLNAKPNAQTVLSIYDQQAAEAQPSENQLFGKIKVETPKVRLSGVEATISLGTDYLRGVDLSAPPPTSVASTETTG